MLTEATVHTSGVNWESVAVIATAVVGISGAFTAWIGRMITHAINDLSTVLQGKLETKEVVQQIEHRLTILEVKDAERP